MLHASTAECMVFPAILYTHLDVLGCGGVVDLVDARPVARAHAHGARLAAGVQHAAPAGVCRKRDGCARQQQQQQCEQGYC